MEVLLFVPRATVWLARLALGYSLCWAWELTGCTDLALWACAVGPGTGLWNYARGH